MKTLPLLLLTIVLAALAGAGGSLLLRPDAAAHATGDPAGLSQLAASVDQLAARQGDLQAALDALSLRVGTQSDRSAVSVADVEAAVARLLDERQLAAAPAEAPAAPVEAFDAAAALARLSDPELDGDEREAIWEELRQAGQLDAVIALLEARAAANPQDADAQVALGEGYLQKIFEVGDGPAAGLWATKADKSFDAALALDAQHWDARFAKAISLSFWPPVFGKQAEAINHFKTLVAQQEAGPSKPGHAQTYLWLGNLYMQQGKGDLAKQAYQDGLDHFPGDAELLKQLGLVQ
jgi:tetratricopeptide (TPR) repeat protein